ITIFVTSGQTEYKPRYNRRDVVSDILTGADTRQLGIDGVAAQVNDQNRRIDALATTTNQRLAEFDQRLGKIQAQLTKIDVIPDALESLRAEMRNTNTGRTPQAQPPAEGVGRSEVLPQAPAAPESSKDSISPSEIESLFDASEDEPTLDELRNGRNDAPPKLEIR